MEDKSIFDKSQPQDISENLRNFIEALVEEVVKEAKPFDDTKKKWLKKYSENEGVNYEILEKNLVLFFETIDKQKRFDNPFPNHCLMLDLAKSCFISDATIREFTNGWTKLVIFVISGSSSMNEQSNLKISKADAVSDAINDFFDEMRDRIDYNVCFSIVAYDNHSVMKMPVTAAKDLANHSVYNPIKGLECGAYISEGLKEAKRIAKDFLCDPQIGSLLRPVMVFIVSDGIDMDPYETIIVANSLKQMPQVRIASLFIDTIRNDAKLSQERAGFLRYLSTEGRLFSDVTSVNLFRIFDMDYLWDPMID